MNIGDFLACSPCTGRATTASTAAALHGNAPACTPTTWSPAAVSDPKTLLAHLQYMQPCPLSQATRLSHEQVTHAMSSADDLWLIQEEP